MCPHCLLMGLIGLIVAIPILGQSLKWLRAKYCKKKDKCDCPKCTDEYELK